MNASEGILARSRVAIARAIDQFPRDLARDLGWRTDPAGFAAEKHTDLESAYESRTFGYVIRLARSLLSAGSIDEALARTVDVAFEALPIHRGFALLRHHDGTSECHVARIRDHVEYHPRDPVPVSNAILQRVYDERVALCTADALSDDRLGSTHSIWAHGIRSAMCVPLWCDSNIIGFLHVDSPLYAGTFSEHDLDFLIAIANFAAITVERIREREGRRRLERYHAPAVVQQILDAQIETQGLRPLGKSEITVLFADLVNFTSFVESASLDEVAELLGGFYQRTAEAVFLEGGTVDKFIGDCVMAFFGAPIAIPDHAERAVRCAVRIREAIAQLNRDRQAAGSAALQIRVAVNSGTAVVGDVGSGDRCDYTAIGSVVNVAARLQEDVAGPGDIVFAEATRLALPPGLDVEALGVVKLRGFEHGVTAFRLRRSAIEGWHMAL